MTKNPDRPIYVRVAKNGRLSLRRVLDATTERGGSYLVTKTPGGIRLTPSDNGDLTLSDGMFAAKKAGLDEPSGASFSLTRHADVIDVDRVYFMPVSLLNELHERGAGGDEIQAAAEAYEAEHLLA